MTAKTAQVVLKVDMNEKKIWNIKSYFLPVWKVLDKNQCQECRNKN